MKDFKRFVESLTPETVAKIFDDAGRNTKSVTVYSDDLEKTLGSLATSQARIDFMQAVKRTNNLSGFLFVYNQWN